MAGDAVNQIKERLSIVDIVAPYVELHSAGKNFKGKSPFTNERTPSFFVSPDRGMYYCFSTSQGGDMFTFVQAMEGVDFKGALKILADKAGVELVPEDPKKRDERDTQYAVVEAAGQFFEEKLPGCHDALAYLESRGVTKQTITKWRIGYAPGPPAGGWRELRTHLTSLGYTEAQLLSAGLVKSAGEGKQPYDVFRDRIMFPIFDPSGRLIAFSGRILAKDTEAPKYVNSPETPLFHKSDALYGYHLAKEGIRKLDFSLIVEGQFDVVMTHQAGYNNAVAVSGTALTAHHVSLLQRLSNRVVLALDADKAGIAAVMRAAELMLARGMDVKVARIEDGKDPADLIQADPKLFKHAIGNATHVIEFLLTVLKEQCVDERTFKLRTREEVLPFLLHIHDHIDRDHFEHVVAEGIGSTYDAVHHEVVRLEEKRSTNRVAHVDVPEHTNPNEAARVVGPTQVTQLEKYISVLLTLVSEDMAEKGAEIFETITKQKPQTVRESLTAVEESELTFTIEEQLQTLKPLQIAAELAGRFALFHSLYVKQAIAKERQLLKEVEEQGSVEAMQQALEKLAALQKELGEIDYQPETFLVQST